MVTQYYVFIKPTTIPNIIDSVGTAATYFRGGFFFRFGGILFEIRRELTPHNLGRILFEMPDSSFSADAESWRDLEPHNFPPDFFLRELMQKVGGIWRPIIFRRILFEGAG